MAMSLPAACSPAPPPFTCKSQHPRRPPPIPIFINEYKLPRNYQTKRDSLVAVTRASNSSSSSSAAAAVRVVDDIDRKQFDETKNGVQGLVESGITSIPHFFIHPPKILSQFKQVPADDRSAEDLHNIVPIIDFSGPKETIVAQIAEACREVGLFNIVNHGIPVEMLNNTIDALKAFHRQPVEKKMGYYNRNMSRGASYYSNVDLFNPKTAATWGDTLRIMAPPKAEEIPEICRNKIVENYKKMKELAEVVLEMMCEGLGVAAPGGGGKWMKELVGLEAWTIVGLYYPPCPQPDLTVGQLAHTDPGLFTLLIQDQVGGLQFNYRGEWVDEKPIPGAIVVNVADMLQIMSNGVYKSAPHRVVANRTNEARLSNVYFFSASNKEMLYGPFQELISPENPPLYKHFELTDYLTRFVTQNFDGKQNLLECYKL